MVEAIKREREKWVLGGPPVNLPVPSISIPLTLGKKKSEKRKKRGRADKVEIGAGVPAARAR